MSNIVMTIDEMAETIIYDELDIDISEEELENIFTNYLQECYDPNKFWNEIKNQNKPTGIDIKKSENEYVINPFESNLNNEKSIFSRTISVDTIEFMKTLDLDKATYSFEDILHIFKLTDFDDKIFTLTEDKIKQAKKIVLKAHPDKSRLEPKYFLFLMKAYKHLNHIYNLQKKNKMEKESYNKEEPFFVTDDPFFVEYQIELKKLNIEKNPCENSCYSFYDWLKETEKINLWLEWRDLKFSEISNKNGYGEWLKSDDGLYEEPKPRPDKIDEKWNNEFEKMRQNVNALAVYNNINKVSDNNTKGSALIDTTNNFTKSAIFNDNSSLLSYTDIKEAFTECIIPINPSEKNISDKNNQSTNYDEIRSDTWKNQNEKNLDDNLRQLYYNDSHTTNISEEESFLISPALEYHYASKQFKNSLKNIEK